MNRRRRFRLQRLESRELPTVTPVGAEFRANTFTTNSQSAPAIAVDSVGDYVVVWESQQDTGGSFGIYGQRYDENGAKVGGEFQINNYTTEEQRSPAVAMDANGNFVVAFESFDQDASGYGIYARRFNNAGVAQGAAFLVNTTTLDSQIRPTVAMDGDGDYVIAWESYTDGDNVGVYYQMFSETDALIGTEMLVNVTTADAQANPAVAMDNDGDFVITWQSYLQDGSGYGVFARRYNSAGSPLGGEFRPNQYTTGQQREPAIALDMNGDFIIAWESFAQDGSGTGIYAREYANNGNALAPEFLVNSTTTADQRTPTIAIAANGNFVVSWSSFGQEPNSYGIYARRFLANGIPDGGEVHVNTFTANHQKVPASGGDSAGNFVTVWQSENQDSTNSSGIFGQRFRTAFPPKLSSIKINDASIQRSRVTSITVSFDQIVTFAGAESDAFSLTGGPGGIILVADDTQSTPTHTVIVITFAGAGTAAGSVNDGNYTFTILPNQISAPGGAFDGNGDGVGGDPFSLPFFRLYGDFNGDRGVTSADFAIFRMTFGTSNGSGSYLWYVDYDGDGNINSSDFAAFRARFGLMI